MKKQLRLVLFAVLVMLLVVTMALVASAATDGATTQEPEHKYSVVGSEGTATPKYYTTLAAAVESIDANGYIVTVLADTSDAAWVLNSNYTYTITGGTEGKTVTFTSHDAIEQALILISAGNVTIENLTLVRGEAISTSTSAAVYVDVAGTITLHNMVTSATVADTLYVNEAATITISGANTNLSGTTGNIVDLKQNATLNITGGTLTGGDNIAFFTAGGKSPTISITNATVVSGEGKAVFGGGKPQITLGAGASVTANNHAASNAVAMFMSSLATGTTLKLDGATLYLSGESAKLVPTNSRITITSTAGTVYLKNGAAVPDGAFDWSKLTLQLDSLPGAAVITEGNHTLASVEQAQQLAKQLALAEYAERFLNIEVAATGPASFKLNGANASLTITAGEYVLDGVFVEVVAGTLTVSGGTFTGAADSTIFLVTGGDVYFAGGTATSGAGGSVASVTGGTLHYVSGTYAAGAEGTVFDVQEGGTLDVDGADAMLDQHRYMLLASGENAKPSYYTTIARAVAAINADGYTITVLADVTDSAWVLDADFTYTIVGATEGLTVKFNGKDGTTGSFVNVCAGNVTISNLSFARAKNEVVSAFVYISGEASVTLNSVTTNVAAPNILYVAAAATVTVSGNIDINDFSNAFVSVNAENVSLFVDGATITGGDSSKIFAIGGGQNTTISLTNSELVDVATLLYADNAAATMQITNTTVRAKNGVLFVSEGQNSTVVLDGATLYVTGRDACLRAPETNTVAITPTAATFHLAEEVSQLTTYLGNAANEDWTRIVFYLNNVSPVTALQTAGSYTFTSLNEITALLLTLVQSNFDAEYGTRFPLAQAIFPDDIDFSAGLVMNHPELVVTLNGAFTVEDDVVVTLRSGTLNIPGGKYSITNGARLIDMQGGTLNVTGGEYTVAGSSHMVKHQGGTLNITGGLFTGTTGADSSLIRTVDANEEAPGTVNISGGEFKICTAVQLNSKVEVNVSNGQFGPLAAKLYANTFVVNHTEAKLFITGGTFESLRRGIHGTNGEVFISGGHFYTSKTNQGQCIYTDGPIKINISGDAEFEMVISDKNRRIIYIASGSDQAEINISGGKFGDFTQNFAHSKCIWINNTVGSVNITGGVFYGGMNKTFGAITVSTKAADSVVNISGDAQFYAYVPVLVQAKATVNIGGGSFNPHVLEPDSYMVKIDNTAGDSKCNISGGTFNNYMVAVRIDAHCAQFNISGGTFTERAVDDTDTTIVNAAVRILEDLDVPIKISGGTFKPTPGHKVFDITTGSVKEMTITGGTFHVSGERAELLPRELFDVEGTTTVLTGATLHVGDGAILPIYNYIVTEDLHLVVSGKYYVPGRVTVRVPYAGDDPNGDGYVIRTTQDMGTLLSGQFASWEGEGTCASAFIPLLIDGEDVVVTLENYGNFARAESFITIVSGTLKVKGGTYTAVAGERLFEILGDATVTITGGTFNVQGVESYMLYIAEGVSTDKISVSAASIVVGEFGEIPLFAKFNISAENLTVYGMSDVVLNEAKTYTISSFDDLTTYLREVLERKFTSNLTVDIQTWVPLRVDNAGAKLVITDGDYDCTKDFMFSVTAGEIEITGGKFTNVAGDIIHVLGPNVKITLNLPDDEQSGMYTAGSIVSATNAKGLEITVMGGRFVELAPDTTNNAKRALFALDSSFTETVNATLTIANGYFEASRMVLVNNVAATVTVNNGTFLSNMVVGTTVPTRATNAHMFALIDADARLTINGGSFDNKAGNYIIAQLTEAGSATTINGGTFNGGSGWFYTDVATSLVINANADATKNPVFTDTDAYGVESCGYFYLDHADATVVVHAGSFTYGESYEPIFRIKKGTLTVNGGTFEGYLFYVTEDSRITVNGGSYTASGAGAAIVRLIGNITKTQFNVTVPLEIGVENYASFFETTLSKEAVLALLSGVNYAVDGSARLSLPVALTNNETWNSPADAQHFIADFFEGTGVTVTFGTTAGVYSLNLVGNCTIVINGGEWSFLGGTLLTLSGGADLVIVDGTFLVERGNVFHVLDAGSNITIGDATDPQTAPQFTVDGGGIFRSEKGGSTVLIYNGSFTHGIYVNELLQPTVNVAEPLFYFGNIGEGNIKSALTIHNGYFEATSVLTDMGSKITTTIYDGIFKTNFIAQNMTSEHYQADGETSLGVANTAYTLFHFGEGAEALTIYNGTFEGGLLHAILGLYSTTGTTWTIEGGRFTDGYYWIYSDAAITLNINNRYDGDNLIAEPTFTATDFYTYRGIVLANASTINIGGGRFAMRDKLDRHIIVLPEDTTLNVTGGHFRVTSGNSYDSDQQLQNDTAIIFVNGTGVNLNISGGNFQAACIVKDGNGATTNISGGVFSSNAISYDDSDMFSFLNNACAVTITGGVFTGNNYTKTIIYIKNGSSTEMTINILGGTFNKSLRWICATCTCTINIGKTGTAGPSFLGLSNGKGSDMKAGKAADIEAVGIYNDAAAKGAEMNFYSGTFKLDGSQEYVIFDQINSKMKFYDGVVVEGPYILFNIDGISADLHILGGTYNCTDVGQLFYFKAEPTTAHTVLIEGGEFNALGGAELFHVLAVKNVTLKITGGEFFSESSRLIFVDGLSADFIIEGGEFSTTAMYMIHIDSNAMPLVIRGGTFTMLEKEGANADDALLYIAGKEFSAINIAGGNFVDNRLNGKQLFFKYNPKAVINLVGNFKMYSLELKDYFLYDYDDIGNSLLMTPYTPVEEFANEYYYMCFGYYNANGPVITKSPTLRAMLGGEGITYTASVPASVARDLARLGTVSYGTLIFPTEYLGEEGWTDGTDFLQKLKAYADENAMSYSSVYTIVDAVNGLITEDNGSLTIRASIVNIKEKNYTRSLMGIAFAKVIDENGNETYYYASHASVGVSANMRDVAKNALNDLQSKPIDKNGRVYCYASILYENRFSRFATVFQDSLRKYLPEEQRKPKF